MALRILILFFCFVSIAAYAEVARTIPVGSATRPPVKEEGDEEGEYDNELAAEEESEDEITKEEEAEDMEGDEENGEDIEAAENSSEESRAEEDGR